MAVSAMAMMTPAQGQGVQDKANQSQQFNIKADDLADALMSVSRQSGREIIFTAEAVRGKSAPAIVGSFTPDEAVRALLAGSGLHADFRKDVVLIRGRSEPSSEIAEGSTEQVDILVTGSRIRGATSPSPVIAATRRQIAESGQTDLGGFVRTLPQNFSGGQNPGVVGNPGGAENANSSSAVNLRGLGPDATLTLINGHRAAYDAAAQGVDISAIPLIAIDRVELVTDGASALYGSDAVGGVANVILRRDYRGLFTTARLGAATDGGDVEQQYSALTGAQWQAGGFMVAADYLHTTPIVARNRSFTSKLDGGTTLLPGVSQFSAVISGHQILADGWALELDGQFSDRKSGSCNATTATSDCRTNGNYLDRSVQSFSVTPGVRVDLPGGWIARLSGTHGESNTTIFTTSYARGVETATFNPKYINRLDTAEIGVEGPLFAAPGGQARLAVGGGYRSVRQSVDSRRTSAGVTVPIYLFRQSRDIYFGYGEVSLPLVGNENSSPFLREVALTGALRYENNKGYGELATPKVGAIYRPSDDVTLKASWGKSFKAPTLFQTGQVTQAYLLPGTIFNPQSPGGAPAIFLNGGRADLGPETATTWTATVAIAPRALDGFQLEVGYFKLVYSDRVVTPISNILGAFSPLYSDLVHLNPSVQDVANLVARTPGGLVNQTGAPYNPASVVAIVDTALRNAARQTISGIDVNLRYRLDVSPVDQVEFSGSGSYLESDQQLTLQQPVRQRAGTIFNPPHWRSRGSLAWKRDTFRLAAIVSYVGGTSDDRTTTLAGVGSYTTLDMVAQIATTKSAASLSGIDVTLSALNLLNAKPALIKVSDPAAFPYDSTNYSSVGRSISLTISKAW